MIMANCKLCFERIHLNGINSLFNNRMICQKCYNGFDLINKKEYINGIEVRYLYYYNDFLKKVIYQFKGCFDIELKDVFLDRLKYILRLIYKGYLLVPVPSYFESDNKRGFNHVEEIFSCLSNKKVKLFIKNENYKQSEKSFSERKNISQYISLNKENIRGNKKILIVDDILTTGNTLKACASLLYKEGIKDIKFLTICKCVEFVRNNEDDKSKISIKYIL
jgi:ComF family protein